VSNKSNMFKGLTATDVHPTFRMDLAVLPTLSPEKSAALAAVLVEDTNNLAPTSTALLSKLVSQRLGVPAQEAKSLTRLAKSFAIRLGHNDDNPAFVADDLIEMQVIPPTSRDVLLKLLTSLRQHQTEFANRNTRQQTISGGGYHLGSCSVFTDYRVAFDKFDVNDVDLDTYQPAVTGLIPTVTLELEVHEGDEEKTIAIRLPEVDLARIEDVLKVARLQLAAAKKQFQGGR